jgi:hypothetical protein
MATVSKSSASVLPHQRIQPVEALAHIARRQAQIHPHAGRQLLACESENIFTLVLLLSEIQCEQY